MTASQALSSLLTTDQSSVRGTITALREDGSVNVLVNGSRMVGVPCLNTYANRAIGDVVQVLQAGSAWVVLGAFGPDPDVKTLNLPDAVGMITRMFHQFNNTDLSVEGPPFWVGQNPNTPAAPPTQLVCFYGNELQFVASGHQLSPIYLAVARTADSIGNDGPLTLQIVPHNQGGSVLTPAAPIVPVTTLSALRVSLEVGERRDVQLPADWVAALTATVPTIAGFIFAPDQTNDVGSFYNTTYTPLSPLTGGVSFGEWLPYTPVWGLTSGTQPNIGLAGGTVLGRYTQVGKTVTFEAQISIGSDTTFGSTGGSYTITYPVPPRFGAPDAQFNALMAITGSGGLTLIGRGSANVATQVINIQMPTGFANGNLTTFTPTSPITLTTGTNQGSIRVWGTYEAA